MSLGAFVVTYKRRDDLRSSLERLLSQTVAPDEVLVVDNAAEEETRQLVLAFGDPRVRYEAPGRNLGSAGGTEYGVVRLMERGHDLILCGDDDDPPRTHDTIERLVRILERSGADVGGAGALGARWNWETGALVRFGDEELHGPLEADFVGGNHSLLLRREVVEIVGPPNGRLFFGYPDLEYCLRVRKAGFRLLVDAELMRNLRSIAGHLGYRPGRSILPRRSYSAMWRNYYTTRNYIHMMRSTFGRADLSRREAARAIIRSLASWARGPAYGARFSWLQVRGIFDGYRGKLGATVSPRAKRDVTDR